MFSLRAPLLPRLRRHPLLWVLVAVVLLTKLVSSSVCVADPRAAASTDPQTVAVVAPASTGGEAGCALGEAACHCACAETLPIPAIAMADIAAGPPAFIAPRIVPVRVPATVESPLRPPIA